MEEAAVRTESGSREWKKMTGEEGLTLDEDDPAARLKKKPEKKVEEAAATQKRDLLVDIGKSTFAAVVPIEMISHESPSAALGIRALFPQPLNLTRIINLVELQHAQLHLLVLVLDLLRFSDLANGLIEHPRRGFQTHHKELLKAF
ncbi:hypothetical protein L2E82_09123 [Cichorium intybus]|uniref:Uncharacterized protein n=1 Tax=Cichorium intybus TaxID=13427 RepID=A0ACB9G861_CICIN|nr:hypothetical protein L2E82_09123 [Cichorium intybus]